MACISGSPPPGRPAALLCALAAALALGLLGGAARADDGGKEPRVSPSLVAGTAAAAPGEPLQVGVRLKLAPHWHVYWINPGDSGLAVKVEWKLPPGWTAGPLEWPTPSIFSVEGIVSYGYSDEAILLAKLTPPASAKPGERAKIEAHLEWLVCAETCVPGDADVSLEVPIAAEAGAPGEGAEAVKRGRSRVPLDATEAGWLVSLEKASGSEIVLRAVAPSPAAPAQVKAYAYTEREGLVDSGKPQAVARRDAGARWGLEVTMPRASMLANEKLDEVRGILVVPGGGEAGERGLLFAARALSEAEKAALAAPPPLAPAPATPTAAPAPPKGAGAPASGLLGIALSAFLGGLLLNLMPCVFPVLAIKVLSFVEQGGASPARARAHGVSFAAGVLASFLVLGGLLLALRSAGKGLGWGFQLQSPVVVAALAALFFVMGLNFLGFLEVGEQLSGNISGRWQRSEMASKEGYGSSFFSGMLATVVATPCTAPFMGSALGYALLAPALDALAIFGALGLGMAAPYVALSSFPALVRRLPRPGAWMVVLKELMAFPMFATTLWLAWVLGLQSGADRVVLLFAGFTLAALAIWWKRTFTPPEGMHAPGRRALAWGGALLPGAAALAIGLPWGEAGGASPEVAAAESVAPGGTGAAHGGVAWVRWSPEALAAARKEGRVVYVDFTAAWCLTCQVNKKVVFSSEEVRRRFRDQGVIAMKADWTNRDEAIARALEEHGRSGVPLNLVYPASGGEPEVLPAMLTPAIVLDALARAGAKGG